MFSCCLAQSKCHGGGSACSSLYSLDWWTVFYELFCLITFAIAIFALPWWRLRAAILLAIATLLLMISANSEPPLLRCAFALIRLQASSACI
jgi:hypothetical protein